MKLLNVLKDVTCLHTDVDDQKGLSYRRKSTFLPYKFIFFLKFQNVTQILV